MSIHIVRHKCLEHWFSTLFISWYMDKVLKLSTVFAPLTRYTILLMGSVLMGRITPLMILLSNFHGMPADHLQHTSAPQHTGLKITGLGHKKHRHYYLILRHIWQEHRIEHLSWGACDLYRAEQQCWFQLSLLLIRCHVLRTWDVAWRLLLRNARYSMTFNEW